MFKDFESFINLHKNLNGMKIKNESQLYQVFEEAIKNLEEKIRGHPILKNCINGEFIYLERKLNRHRLHLLGETHGSRKTGDYIHQNLVSLIEWCPQKWLILHENKDVVDPINNPTGFYIQGLAKLFRLPYEEALTNLYAQDTREYIKRKTGIKEEDIDRLIIRIIMDIVTMEDREDPLSVAKFISKNLKKPLDYTIRLLLMGPKTDLDFREIIEKNWNDYSRERFHKLLKSYSDRTKILVSVGYNHLPAFR